MPAHESLHGLTYWPGTAVVQVMMLLGVVLLLQVHISFPFFRDLMTFNPNYHEPEPYQPADKGQQPAEEEAAAATLETQAVAEGQQAVDFVSPFPGSESPTSQQGSPKAAGKPASPSHEPAGLQPQASAKLRHLPHQFVPVADRVTAAGEAAGGRVVSLVSHGLAAAKGVAGNVYSRLHGKRGLRPFKNGSVSGSVPSSHRC